MADNLNVANDPQPGGTTDSPINDAPTKSPLEESAPVENISAGTASPDVAMPPVNTEPAPMGQPTAPEMANAPAPSATTENLGESSTPPNTDEFLNSILQQQPQQVSTDTMSGTPASAETPPTPSLASEPAPPLNTPLEPIEPENNNINTPLQAPTPEMSMENQITQPPAPAMPEMATPSPEPMQDSFAPATPPAPAIQDDVSLGGLGAAPVAPQPPQASDAPVSSNVFSQAPQGNNSSGIKKIIIAVLALIVIGGGYYAYMMFSGGKTSTPTASKTKTATASKVAGVTANNAKDTQRKTDLGVIRDALMNYYSGSGQYPIATDIVMLNVTGNILEQSLVPQYLAKLPTDPDSTKAYAYKSDGMTFTLSAVLDDSSDSEAVMESGKALYKLSSSSSASSTVTGSSTTITTPVSTTSSTTYPPVPGAVDDAQTSTSTSTPTINSNF